VYIAGLPDGLFSNQKSQFWKILVGLAKENLGIFYEHLVYFTAIGNILWPFGIFCGPLVYFSLFWYVVPRKIWQPWYICIDLKGNASFNHAFVLLSDGKR
jgi:hypothetical protein